MLSRATKRFWKSVAMGLALSPALSITSPARAQSPGQTPAVPAIKVNEPAATGPATPDVEGVRKLIKEGRKALAEGDRVRAEKLARQAQAMRVQLPFFDTDTPEKLLLDIGIKGTVPPAVPTGNPKMLVKQGFDALRAGKLDEAQKLAQAASANPNAKWSFLDDTPTKLQDEIQKARLVRGKAESVKVLAEARKLYEQGKFDQARKEAYRAGNLHGPYSMWDSGEKPEKLIAQIDAAEARARKVKVPAVPGAKPADGTTIAAKQNVKPNTVAANTPKTNSAKPSELAVKPAQLPPATMPKATELAARPAQLPPATMPQATELVAKPVPVPAAVVALPTLPTLPTPPAPVFPEIKTADVAVETPKTEVTTAAMSPTTATPNVVVPVAVNPAKIQAQQCMAEGMALWQAGRLVEARIKYMDAAKCRCEWMAGEKTPEMCLVELAAIVAKQCDAAVKTAAAATTAEARRACESTLTAARSMAAGFELDVAALDAQLSAVTGKASAVAAQGMIQGQAVLEKARLELRSGQCEMARQLATEVFNGPYGMQAEAAQILRSIDVEERNQKVLAANRSYDAALAAYRGKDYNQALAVLRQVDGDLLTEDKRAQMKEVLLTSQKMSEQMVAATPLPTAPAPTAMGVTPAAPAPVMPVPADVVNAATPAPVAPAVQQAGAKGVTGLQGGMPTMTAPTSGDSLASQVQALQEIEYQRLRVEGLDIQSKAFAQFERGETDAAIETLEVYSRKVKATKLDNTSIGRLCRPIEAKCQSFRLLKAAKDDKTRIVNAKSNFDRDKSKEMTAELKKQEQVKDLMKQFNSNFKDGKYKEAELAATKAQELDPDDAVVQASVKIAQIHGNVDSFKEIQERKDKFVLNGLNNAEDTGPSVDTKNPVSVDPVMVKYNKAREKDKNGISVMRNMSEKEREIQSRLDKPVTVSFTNVPLYKAIDDLRAMSGMNIHLENAALAAESVNPESPVSVKVDNVSMKSVLNLILRQLHLAYVIQDEVLTVTTEKASRGRLVQKVYSVADLVIPVDDYMMPQNQNLTAAYDRVIEQQKMNLGTNGSTPFGNGKFQLQNGQNIGTSSNASMTTNPGASMTTQPGNVGSPMAHTASVSPTRQTMQDMLIRLITNAVRPDSWAAVGGSGTIDYMPIGLALVINQTPDVQEQVADLLEALRRLQDLEVSVEVRIITLAETFFERIGLDFALNLKTDHSTRQYEPQLVTNQFKPAGQVNDFSPTRFLAGTTPAGNFTGDLDIPIKSSSFQYAIPPFAYPNNPGFNGGLSLGLAFLSDIQVFMFMEAAQGDRRTNVMQAPKLTLFNGQTATINVSDQQFFVTNVNVVGFGGQIVFVPSNNPFPLGVQLAIQAVVSADRRFVRLNLTPTLSNLASAIVPLFPVTTFITPVFEGGAQGQPIPFTQFIQQPQISTVSIQTTVSIPDGGTVILGGLKTLSEGRNEFGPPVLSKLPYVNRLFKNVGYGREAQSLLLMVTPRIIINSEEEERQTGQVVNPGIGQ